MGGSGGGGGSSGEVSWPTYLENTHNDWLAHDEGDSANNSVTDLMNTAWGSGYNPYTSFDGYDVATWQSEVDHAVAVLEDLAADLGDAATTWTSYIGVSAGRYDDVLGTDPLLEDPGPDAAEDINGSWVDPTLNADDDIQDLVAAEAEIADSVSAFGNVMDDRLSTEILPRFEAGMQDINAVQSSAFVIGRAVIEGMGDRDVAQYQGDLRTKAFLQKDNLLGQAAIEQDRLGAANTDGLNKTVGQAYLQDDMIGSENVKTQNLIRAEMARNKVNTSFQGADSMLRALQVTVDGITTWASSEIEGARIKYVMEKEDEDKELEQLVGKANYDLSVYQYGVNVMAAISGGTTYASDRPTPGQSAIGGAFAGASIGSQISGGKPFGAAAGAIVGGIGGYLLGQ